jgi:hypothetical protein
VKTTESIFKSIADGMKIMADGMNMVAEHLRWMAEIQPKEEETGVEIVQPETEPSVQPETAPISEPQVSPQPPAEPAYVRDATGNVVTRLKKAASRDTKSRPATAIVLNVIQHADGGTDNRTITAKTGFDKKKVANILFRLKKDGKIAPVSRGIYKAT